MAPEPGSLVNAGDVEAAEAALRKAFESLQDGVDKCVAAFNGVVDKINDKWWQLGAISMYLIKKHLEDIRKALKKVLDFARKVLRSGTPVLSLFVTSIDYLKVAEAPLGDVSYDINTPADDNLHYWSGGAAAAYKQKQGAQKAAVDRSAENASAISKWLFDIGKTNVAYAVELVKILIDVASELVNITVGGATGINIQFAVDHGASAIAKLVKAGLNQLVELANKFVATLGDCRELLDNRSKHKDLGDGKWPQAVYG